MRRSRYLIHLHRITLQQNLYQAYSQSMGLYAVDLALLGHHLMALYQYNNCLQEWVMYNRHQH